MHRATWELGKDQACGDRREAGRSKLYCVGRTGVVGKWARELGPGEAHGNLVSEWGDRDGGGIDILLLGGIGMVDIGYLGELVRILM